MFTKAGRRQYLLTFVWHLLHSCASLPPTSTVYYRQRSGGSIFAIDGRDGGRTELEGSSEYARFVGLALHRRNERLFWSDGKTIKSAKAADGSDVEMIVGALARVVWMGANFGQTREDVQMLTVKGLPCVSVLSWAPGRVECLVGLPQRLSQSQFPFVSESDCSIRTKDGSMTGSATNYIDRIAASTSSPIVERIDIFVDIILPHALAIDDREGKDWLYWSNSKDGTIYRSSLRSTEIEVLQRHCWSVRGLALHIFQDSTSERAILLYSLESKGKIFLVDVSFAIAMDTPPPLAQVLLSGLRSPRGLALDTTKHILFFTEKTGRIFQADLSKTFSSRHKPNVFSNDFLDEPHKVKVRRIITRTSMTRLDGIAVDSKYLYWCETNTNIVVRALRRDFQPLVVVGGTANSKLSWPRSIVLGSEDGELNELAQNYYFSEYTGRVSKGSEATNIVNELSAPAMEYLDDLVKQSSIQGGGYHIIMYALE